MKLPIRVVAALAVLGLPALAGCGSAHRLRTVDFADTRVAVVANIPPRPLIFTDVLADARVDPDDPLGSIFRAGSAPVKHAEAQEAQVRMDSALAHVDVAERTALAALRRSAPTLGYQPVNDPDEADFILDIHIISYGLVADSWGATVHFEVDAEMRLIDRRTHKSLWKKQVREVEPVSQAGTGLGTTLGNAYTALALSKLSIDEMIVALENLADFTAARLAAALRHDYYALR
jgi:hypothetical protein